MNLLSILFFAFLTVSGAVAQSEDAGKTCSDAAIAKKSVEDIADADWAGKKVLIRCDLNVPLNSERVITDDTRIRASLPTIQYLLERGAKVAAASHLGRPKNGPEEKYSLAPVAQRLSQLLKQDVVLAKDSVGEDVQTLVDSMANGQLILLENTRFHKGETKNDPEYVQQLAAPFDVFVNDAFGTAHRAHASTEGVTKFLSPSVSGFLLKKELDFLDGAVTSGKRPLAAIVGGSKVSTKITVLKALIEKCDKVVIGGGMVFTFFKARGMNVGSSLVEADFLDVAREAEAYAQSKGTKLIFPTDLVIADAFSADANTQVVSVNEIPDNWMGLDHGPETTKYIEAELSDCQTIVWNGPMGVFEIDKFAKGTFDLAHALAGFTANGATTIVGGGDSVAAVEKAGLADKLSHISTGGGASLELLEGKVLPGVAALDDAH